MDKRTVVACARTPAGAQTRTFRTWTGALHELADWLARQGVAQVVMEAAGVYWKLVCHVLEEAERFTLVVANPERVRAVPGRKTDVRDAEWLATLLRHDLVAPSFIPTREQRDLRELTRYRAAKIQERAREVNRLQTTLESANIKVAAVLTDILGGSGQRILDALLEGEESPEALAALTDGRVRAKPADLEAALAGQISATVRFVIAEQLASIRTLDAQITRCDAEVERLAPFDEEVTRLRTIPGIGRRTAEVILAEIGTNMSRFPTAEQLAAWGRMCPGTRESAGKRRPARTRNGSPWLRGALGEAAWCASRTKSGTASILPPGCGATSTPCSRPVHPARTRRRWGGRGRQARPDARGRGSAAIASVGPVPAPSGCCPARRSQQLIDNGYAHGK